MMKDSKNKYISIGILYAVIALTITFFGTTIINAYYGLNDSKSVGFTTRGYSALTTSLDKNLYASANNSATVKLTVTNPNNFDVQYSLSFSNNTPTYTIDGAAGASYVVQANSSKTNTIVITGTTGTSITVTVNSEYPYSATKTQVINFDNAAPTVSFNPNSNDTYSKTASVTVTVSDSSSKVKAGQSIKYRWQTSSTCSTTASDYTTTAALSNTSAAATSATATASASGLSGTYYLCVYKEIEDAVGNKSVTTKSGTFKFDNTRPTTPTYTATYVDGSGNYTSGTWTNKAVRTTISATDAHSGIKNMQYSANGTSWNTFSFSTSPLTQSGTTWTGTEPWNLVERNQTYYFRSTDNVDLTSSENATFTIRYDLTAPTISLSANSDSAYSKTKSVTVTLTDTGGSGLASGASVKYGWSTSTSTAPSSYTTATLSYSAGASSTTFTASGSGLTGDYYLWVVPTTLKDVATNQNSTTLKSTGTFKFDNTGPVLSKVGSGGMR